MKSTASPAMMLATTLSATYCGCRVGMSQGKRHSVIPANMPVDARSNGIKLKPQRVVCADGAEFGGAVVDEASDAAVPGDARDSHNVAAVVLDHVGQARLQSPEMGNRVDLRGLREAVLCARMRATTCTVFSMSSSGQSMNFFPVTIPALFTSIWTCPRTLSICFALAYTA